MSATSAALAGRVMAERQMTSTCRIFTTGPAVTDRETGEVTYTEANPVTTRCRVRPNGTLSSNGEAGGAELIGSGYIVSVPFAVTAKELQRVKITACPDPSLVGLSLEVRRVDRGDNITARRLLCEEVA